MNKKELITAMQEEGLTKSEAMRAIEGFIAAVTKALLQGERVALFGFGTFSRVNIDHGLVVTCVPERRSSFLPTLLSHSDLESNCAIK